MKDKRRDTEKLEGAEIKLGSKSKAFAWLENFWYHHKWKVIIIGFFAIVAVVGIVQMVKKTEPDISVIVATHTIEFSDKQNVNALEGDLVALMPSDLNGDGQKIITLKTYKIYSESELKEANEAETDANGNPVIYADEAYNKEQIQQYNSYIGMGECSVMIISEYLYNDMVSKRSDWLVPMTEIYGDSLPEGAVTYGIRLSEAGVYKNLESFGKVPDDAIICIKRPFVFSTGDQQETFDFAVEYFKSIVAFGME